MRQDVQEWFATRSYDGRQWSPEQLVRGKRDCRISVVLPARNEAGTVGPIVAALKSELMDEVPLIDELVVIDSDSTDATAEVAAAVGARVHRQDEILPAHGNVPGKGEALWKSLAVTRGDVLAFIDSDLREFDTRFAVGLLGPLLTEPSIQSVKSFYDRPLHDGATLLPAGEGRVTELVARPLLNLFWPQLAGLVQPLAGEYAGRRSLLERVPFVSGYGVEIAMLIDVLEAVGLDAMAQVDLGVRSHRNSSDAALSRMAAQIQLTLQARLRWESPVAGNGGQLTQFLRHGTEYLAETHDISVRERPPMVEIPEYAGPARGRRGMSLRGLRVLVNAGPWLPVPPSGYGGIETVVATLVPELRRAGVHITLATVGPSTLEADDHVLLRVRRPRARALRRGLRLAARPGAGEPAAADAGRRPVGGAPTARGRGDAGRARPGAGADHGRQGPGRGCPRLLAGRGPAGPRGTRGRDRRPRGAAPAAGRRGRGAARPPRRPVLRRGRAAAAGRHVRDLGGRGRGRAEGAAAALGPRPAHPEPVGRARCHGRRRGALPGVPVVGTPLGVLPSLVEHGRTGFLATEEDELVRHLRELDAIDPRDCREAARQWTPAGMARRYLDLYDRLLEANPA